MEMEEQCQRRFNLAKSFISDHKPEPRTAAYLGYKDTGECRKFLLSYSAIYAYLLYYENGGKPDSESSKRNSEVALELRISPLYRDLVTIKVGAEKSVFLVHKGILCRESSYFKAALEGNFREAMECCVVLDDEDLETFERFNTWL